MTIRQRVAQWAFKAVTGAGITQDQLAQILSNSSNLGTRMGVKQLLEGYEKLPWLRAISDKVGYSVGTATWQLFVVKSVTTGKAVRKAAIARGDMKHRRRALKRIGNNVVKGLELQEIERHPALDLLLNGNPRFNGQTAMELSTSHVDLAGEALWMFDLNGAGLPTAFYPLPPTWIADMPREGRDTFIVSLPSGTKELTPKEALYMYRPKPADPYNRGTGIAGAIADELETDASAARYLKSWFSNRARPDILVTSEGLRKEDMDRLEERWLGKLTNKNNVPYFLNRKVDVQVLGQSMQEMQMSQLRKDERDIILHVYGAPPEIFGIVENSNRSTIDASDYLYNKYVVVPRLEFFRRVLQKNLIERYDDRLILDYISPVMEDHEFDLNVIKAAPGAFEIDEIRDMADREPLRDEMGKGFFVPFNITYKRELAEDAPSEGEPLPTEDEDEDLPAGPGDEDDLEDQGDPVD